MNINVPDTLEELATSKLAIENGSKPLCTNLKSFGICTVLKCVDRHDITEEDMGVTPDGPTGGEIVFKVIHANNPSVYVGRLSKHYEYEVEGNTKRLAKDYKSELKNRAAQLQQFYSEKGNL